MNRLPPRCLPLWTTLHLCVASVLSPVSFAAEPLPQSKPVDPAAAYLVKHESPTLRITLAPRTPQQMAAFYEARGFSRAMIEALNDTCYITVGIKNTSKDIVWLDLAHWNFTDTEGTVTRLDRTYWKQRWTAMDIPLAHQSTFRWTLLPEQLDFRPDEREGGNIILPRRGRPLSITARFDTGAGRDGKPIEVRFDKVVCAEDKP